MTRTNIFSRNRLPEVRMQQGVPGSVGEKAGVAGLTLGLLDAAAYLALKQQAKLVLGHLNKKKYVMCSMRVPK